MSEDVTQARPKVSKVKPLSKTVTDREREQQRIRTSRHRAAKKQAAAIEFVRTDASLFLHPDRLSQKAGAPNTLLRRMALKELVDNALDAAESVTLTEIDADTFIIKDDGPGLSPARALALFSVTRPMMSTKLIRRPTRGMVGNGLRVATGAAFASGGYLIVESAGVLQRLDFDRATGETTVADRSTSIVRCGTKVTIIFGAALPRDAAATSWGDLAIRLGGKSAEPMNTHPDWYTESAYAELISSARGTAAELAEVFGVELGNAGGERIEQGQMVNGERYAASTAAAATLSLATLKTLAHKPPKLLPIAETAFGGSYKILKIEANVGGGVVPAVVQVWAREIGKRSGANITLIVNRSPTVAELNLYPGADARLHGCGMYGDAGKIPSGRYEIVLALTTPAISLISDGKTPDLTPFEDGICAAIEAATKRAHRPVARGLSIKDAAFAVMEDAYLKASANGSLPANARQVMYAARPHVLELTGSAKLNDAYFTQSLLPQFIDENPEITGEWDVVYDARGHFVEPHTGHSIPLGTIQVRDYLRPRSTLEADLISSQLQFHQTAGPGDRYGAVLFIEKEGFEPLLRAARIAERFDIAIMSTKGMSVVCAREMIDRLSSDGSRILVAHDLDLAGITIFGTLGSDSARYRFKHRPNVSRLGLTLDQAVAMRLQSERQDIRGDHARVIDGLRGYGASERECDFIAGGQRIELNAMPSDLFIRWLEDELKAHGVRKVIPSGDVIEAYARRVLGHNYVRQKVSELEAQARDFARRADLPTDLAQQMAVEFERDDTLAWEVALSRALSNRGGISP